MVTDPRNPPGCLTVRGALSSGEEADPIRWELALRRLEGESPIRERFERAKRDGELPAGANPSDLARYLDRSFRIASSDGITRLVLPALVQRLVKSAPNVDIRVFPSNRIDVVRQLETGQVDLVIGGFGRLPDGMCRRTLYRDEEAILVRVGHPLTHGKVTKEGLFEFPHVVVELTGTEENERDGFVSEDGVERRVWIERALHSHTLSFQPRIFFVSSATRLPWTRQMARSSEVGASSPFGPAIVLAP
jgi:DNA-binding transcriptional LysR family regulator